MSALSIALRSDKQQQPEQLNDNVNPTSSGRGSQPIHVIDVPNASTTDNLSVGSNNGNNFLAKHPIHHMTSPLPGSPLSSSPLRNSSSLPRYSPYLNPSGATATSTNHGQSGPGINGLTNGTNNHGHHHHRHNLGHHRSNSSSRRRLSNSSSIAGSQFIVAKSVPKSSLGPASSISTVLAGNSPGGSSDMLSITPNNSNNNSNNNHNNQGLLSSSPNGSVTSEQRLNGTGPLNTNSPIALAAAAAVTAEKLSRLLVIQGPLAIRHITSHLAMTIPGFADLSLSKQRRLIIAVLEAEDHPSVRFEKVGWGRWAAKKFDKNGNEILLSSSPRINNIKSSTSIINGKRRESITADLVSVRPPLSPIITAVDSGKNGVVHHHHNGVTSSWADDVDLADDDMMFHNSTSNRRHEPVFDDDDDDDEEEDDSFSEDEEDELGLKRPNRNHRQSETDEEDWQSIGAESLRHENQPSNNIKQEQEEGLPNGFSTDGFKNISSKKEREAIDALVQLSSI